MNKYDVLIIGGGISGISAAKHLVDNNKRVCLIESNSKIGGRVNSRIDKNSLDSIDNGQHVLMGVYYNFLKLLKDIDTYKYLQISKGLNFLIKDKSNTYRLNTSKYFGKLGLLVGILNFNILTKKEKYKTIVFLFNVKYHNIETEDLSCKELLSIHNQDKNVSKYLWTPFIESTLNTKIELASADIFVNIIKMIFWGKKGATDFIVPKVSLNNLIEPAVKYIENRGGKINFNSTMKEFIYNSDKSENKSNKNIVGIKTVKGNEFYSDAIIMALPINKLELLRTMQYNSVINSVNISNILNNFKYSSIISIYVWLDKKVMNENIIQLIDFNIQWIFNKKYFSSVELTTQSEYSKDLLSMTISAADNLINIGNEELKLLFTNELLEVFPDLSLQDIIQMKIIKEKRATFLCSNENEIFRNEIGKNFGEIIFAGDWVNNKLPSTIEGACINGINAAKLCMI